MPIYKPSELHLFLSELGISPKKRLSQNFLIDGNITRKIAQAADIKAEDVVLEIGSGPGSLSEVLLDHQAHLIAVEKDPVLAHALERLKGPNRQLDIFCEDIMQFPIESVLAQTLSTGKKAKLIANLPYHLTTPILAHFAPMHELFSSLVVMVQDEVAHRFTAEPGTNEYGAFTVFLNFYTRPRYGFFVSAQCFYPKPKVNSAVVILELKEPPQLAEPEKFFRMTRMAFSHRRKMLRAGLRELYRPEQVTESLTALGWDSQARPEELSLDDWLLLFQQLERL